MRNMYIDCLDGSSGFRNLPDRWDVIYFIRIKLSNIMIKEEIFEFLFMDLFILVE